jgi:hypothetical protein
MVVCLAGVLLASDLLADGPVALHVESFNGSRVQGQTANER